jgi:hypothetical protein
MLRVQRPGVILALFLTTRLHPSPVPTKFSPLANRMSTSPSQNLRLNDIVKRSYFAKRVLHMAERPSSTLAVRSWKSQSS